MARPRKASPDYRYHISGQAIVTLDGRDFYLGKHDTPESRAKYHALLAEYNSNGMVCPGTPTRQAPKAVTVACVAAEFKEHAKTKYAKNRESQRWFNSLCDLLTEKYGDKPAKKFGPRKLDALRRVFIKAGNGRSTVNRKTADIRKIFKHAVAMELVKEKVWRSLTSLEPLAAGQSKAKEGEPVKPVAIAHVSATAKFLSPVVRDMVDVHVSTGMRPSEVFRMRPCDIERRDDGVWLYRPSVHKNQARQKQRTIPIVGDVRITLGPYLERDPKAFCFSPAESTAWHYQQKRANAKAPRRTKCEPKANGKRRPKEQWDRCSYRRAIQRAAEKAKVPHWFPLQLRHTAATEVRKALGIEHAQHLLGHSHASMTERYAERNLDVAIEAAKSLVINR